MMPVNFLEELSLQARVMTMETDQSKADQHPFQKQAAHTHSRKRLPRQNQTLYTPARRPWTEK